MMRPGRKENHWLAAAALLLLAGLGVARPAESQIKCFPSCSAADGRFLVIASGTGLVTLSEERLEVQFAVPAGSTSFTLGIFDGDGGELDGAGKRYWDLGSSIPYSYTLFADPLANGSGTTIVEMSTGVPVTSGSTMPSNAWIDYPINTSVDAQAPSGNYFYRLVIELLDNSVASYNAFKLRTNGVVSIRLADQPFSYIASLSNLDEARIIYPLFPVFVPTTYDGTFRFFFNIAEPRTEIFVWDGDFDHGDFAGLVRDTDDPDTPNAPFLPPWATVDAVPEGVATGLGLSTGNPPDDLNPAAALFLRPPSIFEQLLFPDSQSFTNPNPSGNQEWEQFLISTDPFDPSVMDATTTSVPAGTYELRVQGADMSNLNALRLPSEALCVSEEFVPCVPLRPFLIGDTVFRDYDGNGIQSGSNETGIAGVEVELVGSTGFVIATATTDADGHYSFPVEAGTYTVRVTAANSDPGGPLDGAIATTPVQLTETVVDDNVLTYDFGYRGTGSISGRIWLDRNGDGVQDSGEVSINDVTVELLDGGGNVIATTTTGGDGNYTFDHLFPGTYSVRVVAPTLPAGLGQTFDRDGTGTSNIATVTLAAGESRDDVDFGYRGTASVGDRVWNDLDGDGVQEGGEAGINGVTVELLDGGGNVIATTTTSGDGNYSFAQLTLGFYTVRVVNGTLPAGMVPTYDLDGTGTPHTARFFLDPGANRDDVDFGYRVPPCAPGTFKDTFTNASFSNNDGTLSWSGSWIESDAAGAGVSSGNVTVGTPVSGYMILNDSPDTGTQPSAARQANLAGFVSATLTVDFHIRGVEADDAAVIEISKDGGATYTVLETLTGYTGTYISSRTFDISASIASNTRIRFRIANNYGGSDDFFKVDQVRIDGSCTPPQNGSIGDRLWYDTDGDGSQDSGEPGLAGTTVELLNSGGTVIASTTTNSNGNYTFANVAPGTYTVRVVASTLPAGGLAPTYDLDGTGTPHTAVVTLASGQNRTDADFGYRGTRTLGDRVWNDVDGDGVQDSGEAGINGVTVRLFLGSTELASTVTSGNGNYTFSNLPDLTYTVKINSATLPAGMTPTYDLDGTATPHQATVILTASRSDVDFGYRIPPVSCTAGSFKDTFTNASFSNNEGTLSWSGSWIESDSAGAGVSSGNVTVGTPVSGYMILNDSPDTGTQPSAARQANLSSFASATLTVDFHIRGVEPDDAVVIEVSNNGGSTYTVLETLSGYTGTYTSSRTYNITAYKATNTRIRFRISSNYGGSDDYFKVDAVRIDGSCTPPPPTCTAGYFKDNFDTASFSNNNGTLSWSGSWVESDSAGAGVSSGNVTVGSPYSGYLFLRDSPDTGTQPSAARQANLSGFASATLQFDFHVRTAVDPDDAIVIEVSNNGGSTYTVLETLNGFSGSDSGSRLYNISSYLASNTRIRFRVSNNYGASDELFKLVQVRIDAGCTPQPAPGTGTIGYWKTHPEDWPVQQIQVGGKTYTKDQAIARMSTSSSGDKTIDLFSQLVAAKLNVLVGNASSCISSTITSADSWLTTYPLGSNVSGSSSAWTTGGPLHDKLDDYNNGLLCAPHRD